MNTIKYFIAIAAVALLTGLQACSSEVAAGGGEVNGPDTPTPVKFYTPSKISTRTTNNGTQWIANDSVGIYMMKNAAADINESLADDRLYLLTTDGNIGDKIALTPAEIGQTIYYHASDAIKFIAYYPWLPMTPGGIQSYKYPIDVSVQQDTTHLDILYSEFDNQGQGVQRAVHAGGPVNLEFNHSMSKIIVNVRPGQAPGGAQTDVVIPGMQAMLNTMPTTAQLDLNTGNVINVGAPQAIGMLGVGDLDLNYDTTYQAIIIPHTIVDHQERIQFITARRQFTWEIPVTTIQSFDAGYVYTFNLSLVGESEIQFEAKVTPWEAWQPAPVAADTTTAESGSVIPRPVGLKANNTYADTINTVFIHVDGPFQMGSTLINPISTSIPSTPVHKVSLTSSYYMSQTEIAVAQFARFLNDIGATKSGADIKADINRWVPEVTGSVFIASTSNVGINSSGPPWAPSAGRDKYAQNYVSWYGAIAYARWAGGELPTEAQWEYAARAGQPNTVQYIDGTTDGSNLATYAWFGGKTTATDVGTLTPNLWNLYDMTGNVWEWTLDRIASASEAYPSAEAVQNPNGTVNTFTATTNGVLRGGGYAAVLGSSYIGTRWTTTLNSVSQGYQGFRIIFPMR